MSSALWFTVLIGATVCERVAELVVARRNARWSLARGAVESGRRHYPPMVLLHTALLVGCLVEVHVAEREFLPWLGWPALAVVLLSQGLRWWCIGVLGPQWNTRVLVIPGLSLVARGPYRWRWLRHPNYVAVALEGLALPLVHTAWVTAAVFTVLNAVLLLGFRIPVEQRALEAAGEPQRGTALPVQRRDRV
ncbi:methyltransferase [Kineococcus xinjiangensis]|uniref:Methyltransferase n=1 Tax=Kineococcus xinjiangensis TaxID=512762 RepID=A0A2S6IDZ4_9ACTN|nr:isoprenylcysteine carboxyl methyltransferase family protein [Kineococcus xinjiangensis]PPK92417.1 methyltransferase [Kineococcus xinjiangensis]